MQGSTQEAEIPEISKAGTLENRLKKNIKCSFIYKMRDTCSSYQHRAQHRYVCMYEDNWVMSQL